MQYYDIKNDFRDFPDPWCYLVWSKRGPGKTYSTLRYMVENKKKFVFLKRTIEDVKLLCVSGAKYGVEFDISPFIPLNRDFGWNIKPLHILKGLAGFYNCDEEGKPSGEPLGYCAALSAAKDIKGFDMSDCDYLVFDEFIPKKHERLNRNEGDQLLDIYMTIRRDRIARGRSELKLICLANATSVNNPTFQILDVVDTAVKMDVEGTEFKYLQDRGILLHSIPPVYGAEEKASGIELAMSGTEWADMAFGGHFSYDDFTSVRRQRIKGYSPICSYTWKKHTVYIYGKDGWYYATKSKGNTPHHYNLNRENEQKKFWYDFVSDLQDETIEDRFWFEEFSMYDLIMNYRKIFEIY